MKRARAVVIMLLIAALALAACGGEHGHEEHGHDEHGHEHGDEHGHEHGHEEHGHEEHGHEEGAAIGVTRWGDNLELFAEHPPMVAGEPASFLAHLTWLPSFLPVEDARVRLTLVGAAPGGSGPIDAEAGMLRPGVYRIALRAPAAGTYRGRLVLLEGGEGEVGGFEVEVHPDAAAAAAASPAGEESSGAISFPKEQQWRISFGTSFAETSNVRRSVRVNGEISTPPSGTAHVHPPVAGRVLPPPGGAFASPGTRVEAGALLATIAPTPGAPEDATRASLVVVEASARVEQSQANLERARRLLADRAVPERQVQEAERALRVAEASLAAARRSEALYRAAQSGRGGGSWRVTSPIAGVVDAVDLSSGESVAVEDVLFRVVDPSVLWLTVEIPERWAGAVRQAPPTAFRLVGEERWRPLTEEEASVVHFARTVDPRSRSVQAVFRLRDSSDPSLRVGAAVEVRVPIGEPERGVVIPASAVLEAEGRSLAYVQVEGESFEERELRLGPQDGARVLVEAGIRSGERVVTEGAIYVRLTSQANSGVVGHGHVH